MPLLIFIIDCMRINPFVLERYFAKHEFTAKYMLSSSDCDGFPMSYILEQATLQERELWNTLALGYTEGPGSGFLRESICRHYPGAKPENVLVASPGELSFILMNLLMEGVERPHAVVVSPAYQSLYEVLNSLGCEVSFWSANMHPDGWKFDIGQLRSLVREETRLIVINFPHNPTGAYLSRAELDEVVDIARSCGAYLYSDEMYRDLIIDPSVEAVPSVFELYEKGVALWGTAKSFGLAGLRTGWFVSQDVELLDRIMAFKEYLSICNSAPSEVLTAIALNHSERFIGPNIAKIRGNVAYFEQVLSSGKLPFFGEFVSPKAGSVAFVPIDVTRAGVVLGGASADCASVEYGCGVKIAGGSSVESGCKSNVLESVRSAVGFSNALVEQTGIMTIPSEMFEYPGAYLRIGFGRECFKEVVDMLCRRCAR